MRIARTKIAVAAVILAGALAFAPFGRAKAQVAQDTLAQKQSIGAAAPGKKPLALVKPYPVLSGFGILPNPAARFRLGTYVNPFVVFAPKEEPEMGLQATWGLQANVVSGSRGMVATIVGKDITAAIFQKIGPVVVAAGLSGKTGKPTYAFLYTIKHDSAMLIAAALMRDMGNGAWTAGGEWRVRLNKNSDITPSFKLVFPDGGKIGGGMGLQATYKSIRASLGSDGCAFNLDVLNVFAIGIGKKTVLLLPEAFVSMGKNGLKEFDVGLTIIP